MHINVEISMVDLKNCSFKWYICTLEDLHVKTDSMRWRFTTIFFFWNVIPEKKNEIVRKSTQNHCKPSEFIAYWKQRRNYYSKLNFVVYMVVDVCHHEMLCSVCVFKNVCKFAWVCVVTCFILTVCSV